MLQANAATKTTKSLSLHESLCFHIFTHGYALCITVNICTRLYMYAAQHLKPKQFIAYSRISTTTMELATSTTTCI